MPVAGRRPHKAALYPRATDVIHHFHPVPMFRELYGAAYSVCCQARSAPPTLQRQRLMAEDQVDQMEGGTAIDGELRAMQFG